MRKLSHREAKEVAEDHPANKWLSQDPNPGTLAPGSGLPPVAVLISAGNTQRPTRKQDVSEGAGNHLSLTIFFF